MATFIFSNSEEEQLMDLATFINKLQTKGKEANDAFVQESKKLTQQNKGADLVNKLLDEQPLVFAEGTEKEIEGYFSVLLSSAKKYIKPKEKEDPVLTKAVNALTSNTEDKPLLRLKILNTIYNSLDKVSQRFFVYQALIKYAAASHNGDVVIREIASEKQVEHRIENWELSTDQKRQLFKLVRDTLKESGRSEEAFSWSIKYISTFETADPSVSSEASNLVVEAIRFPSLFQYDHFLDIPLVKALETGNPKLYQLLKIFVNEHLDAFRTFLSANGDFFKSLGLNEDECVYKMRLLSLASLGATHQGEIPYGNVAKALQIEDTDVESWVITGISEGIFEARMDQLRRIVVTSRCLQRVYSTAQWKQLADQLNGWKGNTKTILKTLQDAKQQFKIAAKPKQ